MQITSDSTSSPTSRPFWLPPIPKVGAETISVQFTVNQTSSAHRTNEFTPRHHGADPSMHE
jgi:hypothetical protein